MALKCVLSEFILPFHGVGYSTLVHLRRWELREMDQDSDLVNGLRGLNWYLVTCRHLNPGLKKIRLTCHWDSRGFSPCCIYQVCCTWKCFYSHIKDCFPVLKALELDVQPSATPSQLAGRGLPGGVSRGTWPGGTLLEENTSFHEALGCSCVSCHGTEIRKKIFTAIIKLSSLSISGGFLYCIKS